MRGRELLITEAARRDFDDAVDWYERERPGLGSRFIDEFGEVVDTIEEFPNGGENYDPPTRLLPMRTFPYRVYYDCDDERFEVVAILHVAREQNILRSRSDE